jgi:predicted phosphodiesterase
LRIGLLADLHGNSIALDAVTKDIAAQGGIDLYLILGDLAAVGFDPVGVLERVAALPNVRCVRGNADRYLVTGERPAPSSEDVLADLSLLPKLLEVAESFAWTRGALATAGWVDWLAALPLEHRMTLPDGTRLLAVHSAPGCDDGLGLDPDAEDTELEALLANCDADLVCVGHHHCVIDRCINHRRVINPGSVSNSFPPDLRAHYTLIHADGSTCRIESRGVEYDREAVIAELRRRGHPATGYIVDFMRG